MGKLWGEKPNLQATVLRTERSQEVPLALNSMSASNSLHPFVGHRTYGAPISDAFTRQVKPIVATDVFKKFFTLKNNGKVWGSG